MPNKPSTKPPSSPERPKDSGFRNMVFLALAGMATTGIGGYLIGNLSRDKPNKPDITDTRSSAGGESGDDDPKRTKPKGWIPADRRADELINLAQCRLLVLSLDPRVISEKEILHMAGELKKQEVDIAAENIIHSYCMDNEQDQDTVRKAVAKGYTEVVKISEQRGKNWIIILKRPSDKKQIIINLNENPQSPCVSKKIVKYKESPLFREVNKLVSTLDYYEQRIKSDLSNQDASKSDKLTIYLDSFKGMRTALTEIKDKIGFKKKLKHFSKFLKEVQKIIESNKHKLNNELYSSLTFNFRQFSIDVDRLLPHINNIL